MDHANYSRGIFDFLLRSMSGKAPINANDPIVHQRGWSGVCGSPDVGDGVGF